MGFDGTTECLLRFYRVFYASAVPGAERAQNGNQLYWQVSLPVRLPAEDRRGRIVMLMSGLSPSDNVSCSPIASITSPVLV